MYDENERIVGSNELKEDLTNENSIRPKWLSEYICLLYTSDAADDLTTV